MSAGRRLETGADLTGLGRRIIERAVERVRAMSVGRVVTFSAANPLHPTASVQPLTPRFVDDGPAIYDPVLDDVPVAFPGSRGFRLDWRLADGDLVLLLFADRPLDDVAGQLQTPQAQSPQAADPQDPRTHDLSDAVAVPLGTFGRPGPAAGPVPGVPGAYQVDLLDWARALVTALQGATVATMLGPQPLDPATQLLLTGLVAQLDEVR